MSIDKQFYVFQSEGNFSSDQLKLIYQMVNKRQETLKLALENLQKTINYMETSSKARLKIKAKTPAKNQTNSLAKPKQSKQLAKKPHYSSKPKVSVSGNALAGRVSYKVKGSDGKLMNIAEIKARIDSIYNGKQGIIKQ